MEGAKTKVFLVDDYTPMRQGLRKLLDLESDFSVCGEASDVDSAYDGILETAPNAAIVDLVLGRETGLELLRRLGPRLSTLPILILSMLPENLNAEAVLKAGARGYIMKSESADQVLRALRTIAEGKVYVSAAMAPLLKNMTGPAHE